MEAVRSSETSATVSTPTQRHNPEDSRRLLHSSEHHKAQTCHKSNSFQSTLKSVLFEDETHILTCLVNVIKMCPE
jgi:hypothetical protein